MSVVDYDFGAEVRERFIHAVDRILGQRANGKVTQEKLGDIIGISSSNINRIRKDLERRVTLEACCRLCYYYKISTFWLLLGQGDMYSNDELLTAYKTLESRLGDLERVVMDIEKNVELIKKMKRGG